MGGKTGMLHIISEVTPKDNKHVKLTMAPVLAHLFEE